MPQSPQFDVAAARQSGATDDEIISYLSKRSPTFDVDGALKQSSKQEVIDYLSTHASPPPSMQQAVTAPRQPSSSKGFLGGVLDSLSKMRTPAHLNPSDAQIPVLQGAAKSGTQTIYPALATAANAAAAVAGKPNVLPWSKPPELKPQGAEERVGAGLEQALEMTATGGPLRSGATKLAMRIPWLRAAAAAAPLMRTGAEAINTGISAALHDQPVGQSALLGAAGAGSGEVLQAIAPKIVESALGIRQAMRGRGRTIGKAVLEETAGSRPATIARQAGEKIGALTTELETKADAAGQAGARASTQPAVDFLDKQIAKYQARNSPFAGKLQSLRDQLTKNAYTGQPIPQNLPPRDLLELKRGVDDTIQSWEPSFKKTIEPLKHRVYRLLDDELDRTVPGADALNQRLSSLIPARTQAGKVARSAPFGQRVSHRLAAHTGALTGAAVGAGLGYKEGGLPKALEYGATGLLLPEIIATPTVGITAARNARRLPLPFMRAIVTQLPKDDEDKQ